MKLKLAFVFFIALQANFGFSQNRQLLLKDLKTSVPIAFAHVIVENLENDSIGHILSDVNGAFLLPQKAKFLVHVNYMGYKILVDTLEVGQVKTFFLEPDVFNLDAVVVTASCAPQRADKSIYEVKVISKKQITSKGATNLTDLLSNELNMRLSHDPSLGSSVSLQGLSGEHLKILIDGVPVVGRQNGNIDLSQINLHNIDHIEIIEGPMSVVYGSNALAGVINIITNDHRNSQLSGQLNSYYESVGVYNFDGNLSMRKKKNSFTAAASRNFFDGYSIDSTLRSSTWKPKRQVNVDLGYGFYGKNSTTRVSYNLFDELLLSKGNLLAPYYETAFDQYIFTKRNSAKVDYILKLKKSRQLSILASFSNYVWMKNTYLKDLTTLEKLITENPDQHDTTVVNSMMSRAVYGVENPDKKFNYQLGYDINYEQAQGDKILNNIQGIGDYATFLNMKSSHVKNLILQGGLRFAYNTKYSAPVVYSLNANFKKRNYQFRGSFAKGFRSPSIKELYLDFHDINHNINGNPDLKAEYSTNISLAYSCNFKKSNSTYSLKVNAYYNDIQNIITLAVLGDGSYSYTNLDVFRTHGFDISLRYNFYPRLTIGGAFGATGIFNSTASDQASNDYLYSLNSNLNVEYLFPKAGITFAGYYKFNGKTPQIALDEDGNIYETYINRYNILDISFARKFWKNRVEVTAGAKNLFNNTILNSTSASSGTAHGSGNSMPIGWGRTFFVKLSYSFLKI